MAGDKEFTLREVAAHDTKKDLYLIVNEKVYNVTSFVDEHPGGEEVLLDVGGQDATEAFEDVGHSDEAREILEGLLVGKVKRQPGDPAPVRSQTSTTTSAPSGDVSTGLGIGLYAILVLVGAIGYGLYQYLNTATPVQA
ncbi:cytochrome b5 [Coccidioides immitis RS]|uniref:Cytochrome b5 n=7 Tax=Coccidioides TaxID=5500 RepID=J3KIR1_COCIM|nr:cytochrome b5 [Coccidioides immitis RS]XP_003065936.1 cytochrome b5, putative [Coccidioides posadasii C735 delta SOWgp]EFW21815.1 cytochrome b5 [Coccidioides posadasii str. Silveira]KMM65274.1 cytochrome b5 [Coccidioides posadasii RMSCC 3488]KMP01169.1 cytochrome b5 [Coccidioides immitis RMSCC 2394]KMU74245.1 cytochrome b5 [Coccidioides immitis RMSCC 3703]KMU83676.1 cytochrome b5 [Coccidioides immitis H538.4]TPX25926.1 hypothetical protein DIZ76_011383 [Coccidioides immitis]|eukprot:XP_003065936.1 cytochrome b5, putative [Coccidioides posadasii C735 delta SOWgp]